MFSFHVDLNYITNKTKKLEQKKMLLKCRFLNQFTASEVAKFRYLDSSTVIKAVEMCPYMTQTIRSMTSTTNTVSNQPSQEAQG